MAAPQPSFRGVRQVSNLNPTAKAAVKSLTESHMKPAKIYASILEKFPEDNLNRRHIYNERFKLTIERSEERNSIQQLFYQAQQQDYLVWFDADEERRELTRMFFVHPKCVEMLKSWPYLILLDSTYKTNQHGWPLVEMVGMTPTNNNFVIGYALMSDETKDSYHWLLETLKNYIGPEVQPKAIITDFERGLFEPIADLFPESRHLLCTWHINKCLETKAYNLFHKNKRLAENLKKGAWSAVMYAPTEARFEEAVQNFRDSYRWCPALVNYVESQWLPKKEHFVLYETNKVLHFRSKVTCRVESAHNALKDWLESSTAALDTLPRN